MFRPDYEDKMSAEVMRVAKTLTMWEAERLNVKWPDARAAVARQAGVAPGALERLERGKLKFVERVGQKLDKLFVESAKRKIAAIEHEMALASARNHPSVEIDACRVAALLSEARGLLAVSKEALS